MRVVKFLVSLPLKILKLAIIIFLMVLEKIILATSLKTPDRFFETARKKLF